MAAITTTLIKATDMRDDPAERLLQDRGLGGGGGGWVNQTQERGLIVLPNENNSTEKSDDQNHSSHTSPQPAGGQLDLALLGISGSNHLMQLKREYQTKQRTQEELHVEQQQLTEGLIDLGRLMSGGKSKDIGPVASEPALLKELLKKKHVLAALNDGSIKLSNSYGLVDSLGGYGPGQKAATSTIGTNNTSSLSLPGNTGLTKTDGAAGQQPIPTPHRLRLVVRPLARWCERHGNAALISGLLLTLFSLYFFVIPGVMAAFGYEEIVVDASNDSSNNTATAQGQANQNSGFLATPAIASGNATTITVSVNTVFSPASSTPFLAGGGATATTQVASIFFTPGSGSTPIINLLPVAGNNNPIGTSTSTSTNVLATTAAVTAQSQVPGQGQSGNGVGSNNGKGADIAHQGFLAPSQLIAPALNFTSNTIERARSFGQGAPVAVPPHGTIFQAGGYGGEPGSNCIMVADYDTIGKTLIEALQQNDTVTIIDRLGNSYIYRITDYQMATDLMRNIASQKPTSNGMGNTKPGAGNTTYTATTVITATAAQQTYAQDGVLFTTQVTDFSLLEIPMNSNLAVITLVSTARPGDNPNERLAVRGILVAYKSVQPTPIGTPIAVPAIATYTSRPPTSSYIAVTTPPAPTSTSPTITANMGTGSGGVGVGQNNNNNSSGGSNNPTITISNTSTQP